MNAKYGFTVALDINTEMPDWKSHSEEELFDADLMFDFEKLRKDENCKKILKKEEDVDD